jgi:very-long-chain ceramide synthase
VFQPFVNPDGPVCFNESIKYSFLYLLGALQVIMLIWFCMIIRVAYRVLKGQGAGDVRSDDEDEEEEEEEEVDDCPPNKGKQKAMDEEDLVPLEEEVGAEGLHFARRSSPKRQYRKASARASGISLQNHPDRKELLGRIGCEKQT